jgi:amino acid transporter
MTEETINAAVNGPKGIVRSIVVSLIAGFVLLVGVSFAIPHVFPFITEGTTYKSYSDIALNPVSWAVIFENAAGHAISELLIIIVIGAQFYCGMSSITANSRMIYAFSRDGAVPFSKFWHNINKRTRTPVHSVWFGAVGAFLFSFWYLWSAVAYFAVTSIAVIGLYIAYLTPVFLRRINPKPFVPGPWKLSKRWGPIIGWAAIVWVIFICIVLMLPQFTPGNTVATFNFAPVAVIAVIGFAGIWYAVSARKWFKGPKIQGTPEELAEIEKDLSSV